MRAAHIDFETGNALDLRQVGAFRQLEHPSARWWCASWAIKDHATKQIIERGRFFPDGPDPAPLLAHCAAGGVMAAHNNGFDRNVWNRLVRQQRPWWPEWRIEQSDCTLARAAVLGVAEGLDGLARLLGLEGKSDSQAMRLMMQPSNVAPCPVCKRGLAAPIRDCPMCAGAGEIYEWNYSPGLVELNVSYCEQDVNVEMEIFDKLPNLPAHERPVWELDQIINERGIKIDLPLVQRALNVVTYAKADLNRRIHELTGGQVKKATQTAAIAKWLTTQGIPTAQINKGNADDLLLLCREKDAPHAAEALQIRKSANRSSTSKLEAMLNCTCLSDSRARGLLHYHGAHTGRWAGRLIQPQNLFRVDEERDGDDIEMALRLLEYVHDTTDCHDAIDSIVGDPMTAIAKCMRRFFIAEQGTRFVGADLSNIEGCTNAWVANETWKLEAYRAYQRGEGKDLYIVTYAKSFGVDVGAVTRPQRQIGKVEDLALGYQGAVGAFFKMAQNLGINLFDILPVVEAAALPEQWDRALWLYSIAKAETRYDLPRELWAALRIVVDNYRKSNSAIMQSWWDMQDAAISAVAQPGQIFPCCGDKIKYASSRNFLWGQLPSGRLLAYFNPRLNEVDDSFIVLEDGTRHEVAEYQPEELETLIARPGVDYIKRIRKQVTYDGYKMVNGSRRWLRIALYGGLQCENNVSGIARDILVGGMLRVEKAGYPLVLTVHDEALSEVPIGHGSVDEYRALMAQGESWSTGLPLAAKAWEGFRYEK